MRGIQTRKSPRDVVGRLLFGPNADMDGAGDLKEYEMAAVSDDRAEDDSAN